ncbi:hypothetical protein IMZ48_26810 [Candidatus Bathyarchaeota archaeon]|nr:hypothetical protein [Candidatus Bathyarchaeota archaeon]
MLTPSVQLSVSSGVITTYSATLIKGIVGDPKKTALMNMPSGAVSIIFTLLVGFGIRKSSHRWAWIIACIIPAYDSPYQSPFLPQTGSTNVVIDSIIGGALMSFLPATNKAGVLVGIYLVNAVVAPLAVFYNVSLTRDLQSQ